jgi:hypothetical protein
MTSLPAYLSSFKQERSKISAWWNALSVEEQREVKHLYRGQPLIPQRQSESLRLVGRFIDGNEESLSYERSEAYDLLAEDSSKIPAYLSVYEANQADDALAFWSLFEYASEKEFFLKMRTFHVCRAHKEARRVIGEGLLPKNFECPLQNTSCPMRQILCASPGKSLQISLSLSF